APVGGPLVFVDWRRARAPRGRAHTPRCDASSYAVGNLNGPRRRAGAVLWTNSGRRQPPILKTLLPHFGQVPCSAGLPFFIVIRCGFWTSTFILSLTQYASAM